MLMLLYLIIIIVIIPNCVMSSHEVKICACALYSRGKRACGKGDSEGEERVFFEVFLSLVLWSSLGHYSLTINLAK